MWVRRREFFSRDYIVSYCFQQCNLYVRGSFEQQYYIVVVLLGAIQACLSGWGE